jgi:hypothetical protein
MHEGIGYHQQPMYVEAVREEAVPSKAGLVRDFIKIECRHCEAAYHLYHASVITSKAANGYHFKTGQRKWPCGTENVLPCRLLWWQVGFGSPAPRAALEHVAVVQ